MNKDKPNPSTDNDGECSDHQPVDESGECPTEISEVRPSQFIREFDTADMFRDVSSLSQSVRDFAPADNWRAISGLSQSVRDLAAADNWRAISGLSQSVRDFAAADNWRAISSLSQSVRDFAAADNWRAISSLSQSVRDFAAADNWRAISSLSQSVRDFAAADNWRATSSLSQSVRDFAAADNWRAISSLSQSVRDFAAADNWRAISSLSQSVREFHTADMFRDVSSLSQSVRGFATAADPLTGFSSQLLQYTETLRCVSDVFGASQSVRGLSATARLPLLSSQRTQHRKPQDFAAAAAVLSQLARNVELAERAVSESEQTGNARNTAGDQGGAEASPIALPTRSSALVLPSDTLFIFDESDLSSIPPDSQSRHIEKVQAMAEPAFQDLLQRELRQPEYRHLLVDWLTTLPSVFDVMGWCISAQLMGYNPVVVIVTISLFRLLLSRLGRR